jgi:hypothetical protein
MVHVLGLVQDKNIGTPVHQALSEGKTQLAITLLERMNDLEEPLEWDAPLTPGIKKHKKAGYRFNVDQCDRRGRTLLSLVLATRNATLLADLLKNKPNVHVPTQMNHLGIPFQPIHQAVQLNFSEGIHLLVQQGAQLQNPCGEEQDTPVLLAARLCHIDALSALLEHTTDTMLEAERVTVDKVRRLKPIELFCEQLQRGINKSEALRGVAMLLCRGAKPPRSEAMRALLCNYRSTLLKDIDKYLADKPSLVDDFVSRCHESGSALHNIMYARHSWGQSMRHFFGSPSDVAFSIEQLVVRKYSSSLFGAPAQIPSAAAETISDKTDPLKLYALFVKRYKEAYDNQLITNSWSTMRWMIADGQCNWDTVRRYVETNPNTRSAIIYKEMFKPVPPALVEEQEEEGDSASHQLEINLSSF